MKILDRRDWVYLLSLLVPFVVYDLSSKIASVTSQPGEHGLVQTLDLIRSDAIFDLGYALFWIGLFAATRGRRALRWTVVFLLHSTTILVVITSTCADQYFEITGSTLDYNTVAEWIPKFNEIEPILFEGGVSLGAWARLFLALFYVALGPFLLTRAVERWQGRLERTSLTGGLEVSFLGSAGFLLLGLGFGSFSPVVVSSSEGVDASLARDPSVNMILTSMAELTQHEPDNVSPIKLPTADAHLLQTSQTDKRNVVLIHLESTREQSVTPYNEDLKTTPFLDELAKSSLLAERAYVVVPRTSKASVAVNCGIDPPLFPGPEFEPGGIPPACLAHLLKGEGYRTVFFQSSSETMDSYADIVKNLGYDEYYPAEAMDTEGFQMTNYFGYEDDIMLKPSEEWLTEHKDKPFLAEYMTGTGHHDYRCIPNRYGVQNFSSDDQLNRYLNCLHYLDSFVNNLIDQYKKLGLYDNTIFVIYGDHGEGFGEHGRYEHGDTIWEEALRIPLLIHAAGWFENGQRARGLSNETDILPTVLEMLGYQVTNSHYAGYSLLHPLPEERTLMFDCYTNHKCLASLKGSEKYIYHYNSQPEEVFDLSKDPLEEHNLASEYSKEELDKRREDIITWEASVNAAYGENNR